MNEILKKLKFRKVCERQDSNLRTSTRLGPEPSTFDQLGNPRASSLFVFYLDKPVHLDHEIHPKKRKNSGSGFFSLLLLLFSKDMSLEFS